MSDLVYYLVPTAIVMILFLSWTITRSTKVRSGIDVAIVLLLLLMMVAMLLGPTYLYLVTLNLTLGDVAIWEIAVFMSVGMMPIGVLLFAKFWMEGDKERTTPLPLSILLGHTGSLRASYIALLVASELFMGWSFNLATGLISLSEGYALGTIGFEASYTLTTYWFVFTMVGEMGLTLLALRNTIRPTLRTLLGLQALVMLLTPTALQSPAWETYALYLEAIAMSGVVALAIVNLRRHGPQDRPFLVYLGVFIVTNAVMMGGVLWWLISGDALIVALSLVVQSVVYFDALLTGAGLGETFSSAPSGGRADLPPVPAVPPISPSA